MTAANGMSGSSAVLLPTEGAGQHTRRGLLRGGLLLTGVLAAGVFAGCSAAGSPVPRAQSVADPSTPALPTPSGDTVAPSTARVLLAYFSRPGENYYRGGRRNLDIGNTEVLARQIARIVDCDTYPIEAGDPYSSSYDATVARNVREENDDARPAIANPLPSLEPYDNILLGSPIWNVRTPMIMTTFAEGLDFTGKTVHPFVTYAVSGLGRAEQDYGAVCGGARIRAGLAVQGEEAGDHEDDVRAWLRQAGLLT